MKSRSNVVINGASIKKYLYCGLLSFSLRLMRFLVNVAASRWLRFCPCHLRLVFAIKNIKRACNVPVLEPCSLSSVFTNCLILYSSLAYPEFGDANFKSALWTFKRQLVKKCDCVVKFLFFSCKHLCTVIFVTRSVVVAVVVRRLRSCSITRCSSSLLLNSCDWSSHRSCDESFSTRRIRTWLLELLHLYWDNNTMTTTQSKKKSPPHSICVLPTASEAVDCTGRDGELR